MTGKDVLAAIKLYAVLPPSHEMQIQRFPSAEVLLKFAPPNSHAAMSNFSYCRLCPCVCCCRF